MTSEIDVLRETAAEAVVRTLVLTDLVDSTRLVEKLGDARAFEVAGRHDRLARDLLPRFGGLEIDKADGFLLLFERPLDAVLYALAYHRALAELSLELGVELKARAGVHLGEVFLRRNDPDDVARGAKPLEVEGLAKATAARAGSLAAGKQTLLTRGAFDLAREAAAGGAGAEAELRWLAHGPYLFQGVAEPVEIFEVGADGQAPLEPPPDGPKARRAVAAGDEVTLGWRPGPGLEIPRRPGWRLEKRLGEGGFGEVWLAVQQSTGEPRVFKFCYDARRLRSLQREVTLFRLLKESLGDREEILRIYDWNFDRAPYYLEAEYVDGGNLAEWVESRDGFSEISLSDRLEIVAQVADALAAAHSVGVLHKDVKPANVLITEDREGRPRAKLTDFGIGEVVDPRELLAKGITVLGLTEVATPEAPSSVTGSRFYMAPEVSEGKAATVQADIYALGVMLYQMVVGDFQHALASGWRRDVQDDLLAEDIASFVDGEPSRRPASAREVADRLRNLEARRAALLAERKARAEAAAAQRALERAHRRRQILGAVAAAAVVVLAVVSVLAVQAMRARDQAEEARAVADSRRAQAEDLIGYMLGDLKDKLEPLGRLDVLEGVGDQAMEYFASVPPEELSDEELYQRSEALNQIGFLRLNQAELDDALITYQESLALARGLAERDPENLDWQRRLGGGHFSIGRIYWQQGDLEAALASFETQLEIARRLEEQHPDHLDVLEDHANALTNVGFVRQRQGDLAGAVGPFRSALEKIEEIVARAPEDTDRLAEYSNKALALGSLLWQLGQPGEALRRFQDGSRAAEDLVERQPQNVLWLEKSAVAHSWMGRALSAAGDRDGARRHFETFLELAEKLSAIEPEDTGWQRHVAVAHLLLGGDDRLRERPAEALEHLRRGRSILERLVAKTPQPVWRRLLASAHTGAGEVLPSLGDRPAALQEVRAALELLEPLAEQTPDDLDVRRELGRSLLIAGRLQEPPQAAATWRRAAAVLEPAARDSGDLELLEPWQEVLELLGRRPEAEAVARRAAALREQALAARARDGSRRPEQNR